MDSDFTIRSLDSRDDLGRWLDFLEAAFKEKGTPRHYFEAHVENDPTFDMSHVWVVEKNDMILSTLRIFSRRIHIDGESVTMCGIGEVSTRPDVRGQGLASKLLGRVVSVLRANGQYTIGCLHSSREWLQAFYGQRGWLQVPVEYADIRTSIDQGLIQSLNQYTVESSLSAREVDWTNLDDMRALSSLYQSAMARRSGALVRQGASTAQGLSYWQDWIGKTDRIAAFVALSSSRKEAEAYCITRSRCSQVDGGAATVHVEVAELCHVQSSADATGDGTSVHDQSVSAACACLRSCLLAHVLSLEQQQPVRMTISVARTLFDTSVFSDALARLDIATTEVDIRADNGFMFLLLNGESLPAPTRDRVTATGVTCSPERSSDIIPRLFTPSLVFSRLDLF